MRPCFCMSCPESSASRSASCCLLCSSGKASAMARRTSCSICSTSSAVKGSSPSRASSGCASSSTCSSFSSSSSMPAPEALISGEGTGSSSLMSAAARGCIDCEGGSRGISLAASATAFRIDVAHDRTAAWTAGTPFMEISSSFPSGKVASPGVTTTSRSSIISSEMSGKYNTPTHSFSSALAPAFPSASSMALKMKGSSSSRA
mmetsp:Transcript_53689/g.117102  ORF Transcript_53689/g.117102 Transcript_53689/m.117102 type:complete len:204 (-) Transcript_53689:149-760(-)